MKIGLLLKATGGRWPAMLISAPRTALRLFSSHQKTLYMPQGTLPSILLPQLAPTQHCACHESPPCWLSPRHSGLLLVGKPYRPSQRTLGLCGSLQTFVMLPEAHLPKHHFPIWSSVKNHHAATHPPTNTHSSLPIHTYTLLVF